MVAVMILEKFEFEPVGGVELSIKTTAIGYLPVYPDLETARLDYPCGVFVTIQAVPKGGV